VNILALDVDPSSTAQALAEFKARAGNPDYTWAFDSGQQVAVAWQVAALDTTLILDREGHVVYRDAYPTPYATLKKTLAALNP
jgi:hypothetical protein